MLKPFKSVFFINGLFFTDIFRTDPYSVVYKHRLGRKHEKKLLFAELIDCNDNSERQMRQFAVNSHSDCIVLIGTAVIVRNAPILFIIPSYRFTLVDSTSCMHIIGERMKSSIQSIFTTITLKSAECSSNRSSSTRLSTKFTIQ